MRHPLAYVALIAALATAACSDSPPAPTELTRIPGSVGNLTALEDYIQQQIDVLLPRGFEASVDARWSTVQRKKLDGDLAGAVQHLNTLSDWIIKKTGDITPPAGETKPQAATRLILNMANWVHAGADAPISLVEGADVAVEFVPAGVPIDVVTETQFAGVQAGPQDEDRIIVISQEQYPGHCNGPLPTARCQYPLFYEISSFPDTPLNQAGRFAVCMVTDPENERRPLEFLSGDRTHEVHERMALAHNAPENPDNRHPQGTIEGGIEILPRAETQNGFTNCDGHNHLGLSPTKQALHYALHLVERVFSPKEAHAYDSGPEHESFDFSNFNAVDRGSRPDLSVATTTAPANAFGGDAISVTFSVENRSRRSGGFATAASTQTTAQVYLFNSEGAQVATLGNPFTILAMRPDDAAQQFSMLVTLPDVPLNRQYAVRAVVTPGPGLSEVEDEEASGNNSKDAAIRIDSRSRDNIAIYKNYNAWFGENKDEAVLQAAPFNLTPGVGYVVRPMSGLAAGIPAETELIIITSAGNGNLLNQITQQRAGAANLEAWVRNGGWLVIHAGDNGPDDYIVPGLTGPADELGGCTGLTLQVANHALIRGPDAVLGTADDLNNTNIDNGGRFCNDNHGSLAGVLPAGAEVLINEQGGSQRPVYATYELGSGRVIVTTLTLEFSAHTTQTLINHFYWAINGTNAGPALRALMANSVAQDAPVTVNTDGTPRNP